MVSEQFQNLITDLILRSQQKNGNRQAEVLNIL